MSGGENSRDPIQEIRQSVARLNATLDQQMERLRDDMAHLSQRVTSCERISFEVPEVGTSTDRAPIRSQPRAAVME